MKYLPRLREVEETFKGEGTARTNSRSYESVVSGLQRYVGPRLGGTFGARFRHLDFTHKAVGNWERLLSWENEPGGV